MDRPRLEAHLTLHGWVPDVRATKTSFGMVRLDDGRLLYEKHGQLYEGLGSQLRGRGTWADIPDATFSLLAQKISNEEEANHGDKTDESPGTCPGPRG